MLVTNPALLATPRPGNRSRVSCDPIGVVSPTIWTFIMQSVAFISSTSQDRIKLIFSTLIDHTYLEQFLLHAPMTTYLKDLTQSIGRYGGLSWQKWV